jgi:hypothetical protein
MPEENYLFTGIESDEMRVKEGYGTDFDWIVSAKIQKILIDPEAQHVVIACLNIKDARIKSTTIRFLTRFQLDPKEVERIEAERLSWRELAGY